MFIKNSRKKTRFWHKSLTIVVVCVVGVMSGCSALELVFPIDSDLTSSTTTPFTNALDTTEVIFSASPASRPVEHKEIEEELRQFSSTTLPRLQTDPTNSQKVFHIENADINVGQNIITVTFVDPQEINPLTTTTTLTSQIHNNNPFGLERYSEWTKLSNYNALYYRNSSNARPTTSVEPVLNYVEYHSVTYITSQHGEEIVRIHMIYNQPGVRSYTDRSANPLAEYDYDVGYGILHNALNTTTTTDLPTGTASYTGIFLGQQKMEVQTRSASILTEDVRYNNRDFLRGTNVIDTTAVLARESNVPIMTFEVDFSQEEFEFRIENVEMEAIKKVETRETREGRQAVQAPVTSTQVSGTITLEEILGSGTIESGELLGRVSVVQGYIEIEDFFDRRRVSFDEFPTDQTVRGSFYGGTNFDIEAESAVVLAGTLYGSATHPIGNYGLTYHINGVFLAERDLPEEEEEE